MCYLSCFARRLELEGTEEHSRLEGFKLKQILAGKEKTTDSLFRARRERGPQTLRCLVFMLPQLCGRPQPGLLSPHGKLEAPALNLSAHTAEFRAQEVSFRDEIAHSRECQAIAVRQVRVCWGS